MTDVPPELSGESPELGAESPELGAMTDVPLPKPPSMSMLASSAELRYTERCLRSYGEACAQAERERILALLPWGYSVDPQWLADEIRSAGLDAPSPARSDLGDPASPSGKL